MMTEVPSILNWLDEERLACPRANLLTVFDERSHTLQSTPDQFILMKSRGMIEWYEAAFAADPPKRVLEIGIFKGGSVVLFSELWRPERLVAVDIAAEPIPALAEYVRRCELTESVKPVFGIDQADATAMRSVIARELGTAPLDLVVDDGCHWFEETRATFETVYPFLRPGGVYVIEDWAWAHWPGAWQESGGPWPDKPAPTLLALELAMLCASRSDLVESVEITPGLIVVRKGAGVTEGTDFALAATYLTAGRVFLEEGFAPPSRAGEQAPSPQELERTVRNAERELASSRALARELADEIRALRGSQSWRVTAPLRRLKRALRRTR